MGAIFTALFWRKAGTKLGALLKSPYFWAALLVIGAGAGTFFYLKSDKKEAVQAAVQGADQKATVKTLETNKAVDDAIAAKEPKFIILHDQTVKDYTNARATLQAAPAEDRNAQAPRLIIDTLNDLDRMRAARDSAPVSNSEVPAG